VFLLPAGCLRADSCL
jgi:hypothetical protein